MSVGKTIRLKRVLNHPTNTSVICALDHGMTSPVFLEPLADIRARVTEAVAGGANVLMLSRGMSRIAAAELSQTTAVAYMLSASADPGENPSIAAVAEVEEALRSGADAVVLYVALGTDTEQDMIERLAEVGSAVTELTPGQRVKKIYLAAFCRPPSEQELAEAMAFLSKQAEIYGSGSEKGLQDEKVWTDLCHVLFNVKEFVFLK
jgi:hypothetical protein